jgi:hypothetical protein
MQGRAAWITANRPPVDSLPRFGAWAAEVDYLIEDVLAYLGREEERKQAYIEKEECLRAFEEEWYCEMADKMHEDFCRCRDVVIG